MTNSGNVNSPNVRLQQMLFGYDRGHGLLASSHGASKSLASKILPDTDWDPRVSSKSQGYVSARPVQGEKTFVLMRTWRAHEMPRPGCVWTHVLAIAEADLSRIPNLQHLDQHFERPTKRNSFESYSAELVFDPHTLKAPAEPLDERIVRDLIDLVYFGRFDRNTVENEEDVKGALFAIWSQQWPALRRQFSFRSASLSGTKQTRHSDFEVELKERISPDLVEVPRLSSDVLDFVVRDVVTGGSSEFRRFLWRYGADAGATRQNLLFLSGVYHDLHQSEPGKTNIPQLIAEIGETFRSQSTALLLKKDLTQPSNADFSMLPDVDPFDVVIGVQSSSHPEAFPELGALDKKTIKSWISSRQLELSELLVRSADDLSEFADSLFAGVAFSKDADFNWTLIDQSETAFRRIARLSIAFLNDDRVEKVGDELLLEIIRESNSPGDKSLVKLVPRLLARSSTDLIAAIYAAAPNAVTKAITRQFAAEIKNDQIGSSVHTNWLECVKDNPEAIIEFAEKEVESRSQLLACRFMLNADSKKVPLTVWTTRLNEITDDLHGYTGTEFRVFLIIQALSQPSGTAPIIFQDAFDHVHDALARDRLNFRTEMQLSDHLPHIGWFKNWDKCLRLKIATVACYKHLGLSKKELRKMTSNSHVEYELLELWSGS